MIYFGVSLFHNCFKIVALSEGFAPLDENTFHVKQQNKLQQWIASLKIQPTEPAQWFFDELEFNNPDYPSSVFHFNDDYNSIYLVNHRKLLNVVQFFYEWLAREQAFPLMQETAFFLASSIRIFDAKELKPFKPKPQKP